MKTTATATSNSNSNNAIQQLISNKFNSFNGSKQQNMYQQAAEKNKKKTTAATRKIVTAPQLSACRQQR